MGVMIWVEHLEDKNLVLHIDNLALVPIINHKSSKSKRIMVLIRLLVLQTPKFNIQIRAQHISDLKNKIADIICRFQWFRFHQLAPWADSYPPLVPMQF